MTKYQKEFYKFAVARENFETICDVADNFTSFQEQLIYEFWQEVKSTCEKLLKEKKGWKMYLSTIEDPDPECSAFRDEFGPDPTEEIHDFSVMVSGLYNRGIYGLYLTNKPSLFAKDEVLQAARENKKAGWKFGTGFPYHKSFPEDFSEFSSFKKIHPDNRHSLVQQYATAIVDAVKELEPFINKHILKKS